MMKNRTKNNVYGKMTIHDDDDDDEDNEDLGLALPMKESNKMAEGDGEVLRQLKDENGRQGR